MLFIHRENQEAKISSKEEYQVVLFSKEKLQDYLARHRNPKYSTDRFAFSRRFFRRVDPGEV